MSQFPDNDRELVNFLKQHCPQAPPANPALEDQLLSTIAASQSDSLTALRRSRQSQQRSIVWFVPPAIAAGLVATMVGYQTLVPSRPSGTELASLETFLENNWSGTLNSSTDDEAPLFSDVTMN